MDFNFCLVIAYLAGQVIIVFNEVDPVPYNTLYETLNFFVIFEF